MLKKLVEKEKKKTKLISYKFQFYWQCDIDGRFISNLVDDLAEEIHNENTDM